MGSDPENGYTGVDKIVSLAKRSWRIAFPRSTMDDPEGFSRVYLHRYHPGIDKDFVQVLSLRQDLAGILEAAVNAAEDEWDKGPSLEQRGQQT